MKKITAYQIAPEYQTSTLEYSDVLDCVYVFGNSNLIGIRADEIDEIGNALEGIAEEYEDIIDGKLHDINMHAVIWYHLPKTSGEGYTRAERLKIIDIANAYVNEPSKTAAGALNAVCAVLEILHGMPFDWHMIRGCCQGDWQYMICPDEYGREYRDEIETEYFNTGEEWKIDDDGDEYTIYTYRDARREIADSVGCDPSDVILYAFVGYTQTPKYKEV